MNEFVFYFLKNVQVSQTRFFRCVSKRAFSRSAEGEGASCFRHWFRISCHCGSSFHGEPLTSTFRSAAVGNLPDSVRLSGCQYKSGEVRPHLGGGADSHRQAHCCRLFGTFQLNGAALTKPSLPQCFENSRFAIKFRLR